MNINKRTVKSVLVERAGSFLTVKEIQGLFGVKGDKSMRKISGCLSRLRRDADIVRKKNSIAFTYCFKKSALHNAYSEAPPGKKAIGDNDFSGYNFIELIAESIEAYCEECKEFKQVLFCAEKNGHKVFLCKKHGKKVDKLLCGYGGAFPNE